MDKLEVLKNKVKGDFEPFPVLAENFPIDLYHHPDCPGLSRTDILNLSQSYALFKRRKLAPKKPSLALNIGQLYHTMLLEPEKFDDEFIVYDGRKDKRLKEYAFIVENHSEKTIVKSDELKLVNDMVERTNTHPIWQLVSSCNLMKETTFFYPYKVSDPQSEHYEKVVPIRFRPDVFLKDDSGSIFLFDPKTTLDASPQGFKKSCVNYGYFVQSYVYLKGMEYFFSDVKDMFFFAIEKEPPHMMGVYNIESAETGPGVCYKELAEEILTTAIENYFDGLEKEERLGGFDYSYNENLCTTLQLPHWALNKHI